MTADAQRMIAQLRELAQLTGTERGAQRVAWTDTWRRPGKRRGDCSTSVRSQAFGTHSEQLSSNSDVSTPMTVSGTSASSATASRGNRQPATEHLIGPAGPSEPSWARSRDTQTTDQETRLRPHESPCRDAAIV
jgi:hypothetical protein